MKPTTQPKLPEPLVTIKQAAQHFCLPVWKISGCCKSGCIPFYRVLNGRRLVRLSEIEAAIQASRVGYMNTPNTKTGETDKQLRLPFGKDRDDE